MRRITKTWLVIASFLVVSGLVMFAVVMTKYRWDFTKLSTEKFETVTYEIGEDFKNLSVNVDTADITIKLSQDDKCRVECLQEEKSKYIVDVRDNTLGVEVDNNKNWYDYISVNFVTPKITVYLPENEYGSFKIETITGDIRVDSTVAEKFDFALSTGDIKGTNLNCSGDISIRALTGDIILKNVECKNLVSDGSTGDMYLENVIGKEKISITRSTGDIDFENSDAVEIYVKTGTGDVEGTLRTDKNFVVATNTGSVDVPKTSEGGICSVTTNTGDIDLSIK